MQLPCKFTPSTQCTTAHIDALDPLTHSRASNSAVAMKIVVTESHALPASIEAAASRTQADQRRYFGTKMAARMTRSGRSTCNSLSTGLLDCKFACFALTALIEARFVFAASPPCVHSQHRMQQKGLMNQLSKQHLLTLSQSPGVRTNVTSLEMLCIADCPM